MGFEDFAVLLYPTQVSNLRSNNDVRSLEEIVKEVRNTWSDLQEDEIEMSQTYPQTRLGMLTLFYDSPVGLFQLSFLVGNLRKDDILISLRFAYCNPRSVYEPFCMITEWLMNRYALYCHIVPDLALEQQGPSKDVHDAVALRTILIPSMDYNRKLWQLDAQSDEEAVLRPGDAVARFIAPLLTGNT